MTSFWVVAGVFIVGALMFVLPTLWSKRNRDGGVARDATNIDVYRDQLAELDSDLRSDILTREQYEQSKRELQQRMLEDIPQGETMAATLMSGNRNVATITLTTLAVPLLAVSLYLWLGNTKALLPQPAATEHPAMSSAGSAEGGHPDFSSVLENLIARLRDQPDDIEGWLMLGRTYAMMQRFNEAKEAYEKVLALAPDNSEVLTDYADIVAMTHDGSLVGEPYELIKKALRLDARNPKALALAGTAEFEQKKYKEAAASWEKLLALVPPSEAELVQSVRASIDEAKSLASGGKGGMIARAMEQPSGGQTPPPTENKPAAAAGAGAATAASGTLSGKVTLGPAMAAKTSPTDSVYIFARAKAGPRAPLATLRLQVKDLPASFTLNDSMARSGVQLSTFPDEVVVGARISKSGSPMPQSGDLQGLSQPTRVGDKSINVVIDQQLP
ncbi:cytochrome c-type biogenesis protein CcmH [Nitrosospira sp. Nsp2]|uniref:c-type cytochrome biogenesis protein CcmI n=1 Tax=Nitrosospira sp. Nsp2 TaxID=136548 RepID=UPI000D325480|nr:c-type cytochrome biogenesis protein CcmI [Nitrosospira sp. Nsp2]PTR16568.1 cytochrome c-type biogenesis protein CcmH [Nitrosospira sp. Nsp2]